LNTFLFLDIDGVLNSHEFFYAEHGPRGTTDRSLHRMIDPRAVLHLNAIIEASRALVVVSSSWRQVHAVTRIKNALMHHGFVGEIIGRTGYRSDGDSSNRRGFEIQDWLDANAQDPYRFVILDDSADMGTLLPKLVRTTWERGLLAEHVAQALKLLEISP
jgi:HAD domain in Swiss Army Knife RNA repair proteins